MAGMVLDDMSSKGIVIMSEWILFAAIALVTIIMLGGVWAYFRERRVWNEGCCGVCGSRWLYNTSDSQGGLNFECECGRNCWITYRSVLRSSKSS